MTRGENREKREGHTLLAEDVSGIFRRGGGAVEDFTGDDNGVVGADDDVRARMGGRLTGDAAG